MKKPKKIKNENDFRRYIHATAEEVGCLVSHVESPITSPGFPDLVISLNNRYMLFEVKVWRDGIHMLPSQKKWHRDMAAAGCLTYVICYIDGGIYVVPGGTAADLKPTCPLWKNGRRIELESLSMELEAASKDTETYEIAPDRMDERHILRGSRPPTPRKLH